MTLVWGIIRVMNKPLTSKQKLVMATIADLTNKLGNFPTLEQLRKALNYKAISSVQRHTNALKEKGYLGKSRGISIPYMHSMIPIPLVGNVAAGVPILAVENIEAYIPYDAEKIKGNPKDYFFLRAVGDSMNEANVNGKNIDSGDLVLIKNQPTADQNQRVLALIGDEATIKKLRHEGNMVVLQPESDNSANKPIYVFEDLIIQGIVVDVEKVGDN